MFENCTIKYLAQKGKNDSVQVEYPAKADGSIPMLCIPLDEDNIDYQDILAWVADGNTIEEAD